MCLAPPFCYEYRTYVTLWYKHDSTRPVVLQEKVPTLNSFIPQPILHLHSALLRLSTTPSPHSLLLLRDIELAFTPPSTAIVDGTALFSLLAFSNNPGAAPSRTAYSPIRRYWNNSPLERTSLHQHTTFCQLACIPASAAPVTTILPSPPATDTSRPLSSCTHARFHQCPPSWLPSLCIMTPTDNLDPCLAAFGAAALHVSHFHHSQPR